MLVLGLLLLLGLGGQSQAVSEDSWIQCPMSRKCKDKFGDGSCDKECRDPECLWDGFDCLKDRGQCNPGHTEYCRAYFGSGRCDQGCNTAACGWDGSDCARGTPRWARGTLLLHARLPPRNGTGPLGPLLWALSVLLQTPLSLRDSAPLDPARNLFDFSPQELRELLENHGPNGDANGSLHFLQVDNRPCSLAPSTCFPYATEAASFLRAAIRLQPPAFPVLPELTAVIGLRGLREEIGTREEEEEDQVPAPEPTPAWIWAVVAVSIGLLLVLPLSVFLVTRRLRGRRSERGVARRRSKVAEDDGGGGGGKAKAWIQHATHQDQRPRTSREKDKISLRKKKKAKEAEKKRRREPLGEDAIRMRPLRRDQDPGSDTDFTQSSMEDVRCSRRAEDASICDHRTPEQRHFRAPQGRRPMQPPPRGWERPAMPPPLLSPPQQSAEWCGPDGSVVLIRAVRSGLDRVVLELLQAGVPVNNTDHTGRSALHWACSVNHLSLARTLIRYGAAVDLQDNKGETALFLSALHGCYDAARLLLLHGASPARRDRRGRRPADVAREALHHQVLELLLAHQVQGGVAGGGAADWEERALGYPPWGAEPGLPGRSASFSGIINPPPQSDWSMGRVQYPPPQSWRPQLGQSATALVPPRVMGRSPRPISTLQEVTSEDEDRERPPEAPRAATPHFLSPQPAPRQRSFSCTQHALQRRSAGPQPEPNYLIVTDRAGSGETSERAPVVVLAPPPPDAVPQHAVQHAVIQNERHPPGNAVIQHGNADPPQAAPGGEQKARGERLNNDRTTDSRQTAL